MGIGQEGSGSWTVSEGEGHTMVFALGCVCACLSGALMARSRSAFVSLLGESLLKEGGGRWSPAPSPIHQMVPSLRGHTPGRATQQVHVVLPALL